MTIEWLRTDIFCFTKEMPNYIEKDHLAVMGHRSDMRAYYACIAIPENLYARPEAYKQLRRRFDSYLKEPVSSPEYSEVQYAELLDYCLRDLKGFVLDSFPTGE